MTEWRPKSPLPMPVDLVMHSPALAAASGAVYRMTIAICLAYWLSGCKTLPKDEINIASLARATGSAWYSEKTKVHEALAAILPSLDAAYAHTFERAAFRSQMAMKGVEARRRNALARSKLASDPKNPTLSATSAIVPTLPIRAPKYKGNGNLDHQARAQAVTSEAVAKKAGMSGLLREANPPR